MSPRRIAKILAYSGAVALAAILITTVWLVRHRNSAEAMQRVAGLMPHALAHARHFHWTEMKAGLMQWQLSAAEASYSDDRKSLRLSDAKLAMVGSDGRKVVVDAPIADLKLNGNHVSEATLSGGIRIAYGSFVLTTRQATFRPDSDELSAPGFVTITGKGMSVTGVGLKSHPRERLFALESHVHTLLTPANARADAPASGAGGPVSPRS